MPDFGSAEYEDWSFTEQNLWDQVTNSHPELAGDREAEMYYHLGYFSDGDLSGKDMQIMQDALINYLNDNYDIDWDQEFDWEDYREWYDAA